MDLTAQHGPLHLNRLQTRCWKPQGVSEVCMKVCCSFWAKPQLIVSMWCPGWRFPQIRGLRFGHVDHPQGPTCTARACRVWTCKSPGNSGYVRFILSQKKGNLLVAQPDWIYLKDTTQLGFTISSRDAESCLTWWVFFGWWLHAAT